MKKCQITHDFCSMKPSGLNNECFGHCSDAKDFLEKYSLIPYNEYDPDESKKVLKYLESEYNDLPRSCSSFLARSFEVIIKHLKKEYSYG